MTDDGTLFPRPPRRTDLVEDMTKRPESSEYARTHARSGDPGTSHAAAAATSHKATMLARLEETFRSACEDQHAPGLTADVATALAGYRPADGAWKRVSDLLLAGVLADTGLTQAGRSGRQQRVLCYIPPTERTSHDDSNPHR